MDLLLDELKKRFDKVYLRFGNPFAKQLESEIDYAMMEYYDYDNQNQFSIICFLVTWELSERIFK